MAWDGRVPFIDGRQAQYDGERPWGDEKISYRSAQFHATLKVSGMYSGRSAKGIVLRNETTGDIYYLFIKELLDIFEKVGVQKGGYITAMWKYVKRGMNYGIAVTEAGSHE